MENSNIYKGLWWLPSDIDNKMYGELIVNSNDRSTLEVVFPKDTPTQNWVTDNVLEIVYGESITGESITLTNCRMLNFEGFTRVHQAAFIIETIFIGALIQHPDDEFLTSAYMTFTHLNEWVQIPIFELKIDENEIFVTRKPAEFSANFKDFDISLIVSSLSNLQISDKYTLEKNSTFYIETEVRKTLSDYRKTTSDIQNFLSLAFTCRTFLTKFYYFDENDNKIDIYFDSFYFTEDFSYPIYTKNLFRFQDIKNKFSSYLQNWFIFDEIFSPIPNLYISILNNPYYYSESIYLHLMQIIETYHRRKFNTKMSLKDRIISILRDLNKKGINLQSLEIDKNGFAERVKNTRNYFTHYDRSPNQRAISHGPLLITDIQKLRGIIEIIFLIEIGFPSEFINQSKRIGYMINGYLI